MVDFGRSARSSDQPGHGRVLVVFWMCQLDFRLNLLLLFPALHEVGVLPWLLQCLDVICPLRDLIRCTASPWRGRALLRHATTVGIITYHVGRLYSVRSV